MSTRTVVMASRSGQTPGAMHVRGELNVELIALVTVLQSPLPMTPLAHLQRWHWGDE